MKTNMNSMLTVVLIVSLQTVYIAAMDSPQSAVDNKSSYREQAVKMLPKISDKNPKCDSCLTGPVITYHDNQFIEEFIKLFGGIVTEFLPDEHDKNQKIMKSIQVRMGQWKIIQDPTVELSTGGVIECVAVALQHKESPLAALYHYFERDDLHFEKLLELIKEIKYICEQQSVDVCSINVSLITGYLSPNLLAIKQILEEHGFIISLIHARPRCWLNNIDTVECDQRTTEPERLIFVTPSELKVFKSHHDEPGEYGSETPASLDEICNVM